MTDRKSLVLHPFLAAIYPILALLGHNIEQVGLTSALRAILASLIGTTIILLLIWLVSRDWQRAAIVATLVVILFFSYGHVYNALRQTAEMRLLLGRHRYLVPLWLVVLGLGFWWALFRLKNTRTMTGFLNVVALVAVITPLISIVPYELRSINATSELPAPATEACRLSLRPDEDPPDIYYIILDGYTREDVLSSVFDFDNFAFLDVLSDLGFYVANQSQTNYAHTELSLPSSLNLNYLDTLDERLANGKGDQTVLGPLTIHNAVRRQLGCLGYREVVFESGYYITEWQDADQYLCRQAPRGLNPFESMLLYNSAGVVLSSIQRLPQFASPLSVDDDFDEHRNRILCAFDELDDVVTEPGPKFVLAHIISPHEPYVLGPNGEPIQPEGAYTLGAAGTTQVTADKKTLYRDQVIYVNKRMTEILHSLIVNSDSSPIVIIQADHGNPGTEPEEKMAILNAYYLPGDGKRRLYETITPVNTFRLIFDTYFNGDYDLLEDISYFSEKGDQFNFVVIPNSR